MLIVDFRFPDSLNRSKSNIKSTIWVWTNHQENAKKLVVYGHDFCGQARTLVRALNQKEIEYEWRDIHNGDPIWKDELRTLANGKSQRAFKRVLWESAGRSPDFGV